MGPLLLSRLMNLTEAQEGVINIAFKIADEEGLLLLDMKDLQALLANLAERADEIGARYGNVTKASVGAIQRTLLILEQQGGAHFFGEPALQISDLMRTTRDGRGAISVLAADRLMMNPRLYATFLLWLMSELFEQLPEVGDPDKPKLVFFFDEAHLLFDDAPKILVDRVEQVVRLIRSKGVGVYFVTQSPLDVPETVLAQLGNRVQHALRAYTPREQKAVKTAADTFRPNPKFKAAEAIIELGVGEALLLEAADGARVARDECLGALAAQLQEILVDRRHVFEQGHQAGVAPVGLQVGAVGIVDRARGVVLERGAAQLRVQHLLLEFGQDGGEDRLLVGEVCVEGAVGDAGRVGDVGHSGGEEAVAFEDSAGRVDQCGAGPGAAGRERLGTVWRSGPGEWGRLHERAAYV
jgi:DNA helicase HerA-like ATPase